MSVPFVLFVPITILGHYGVMDNGSVNARCWKRLDCWSKRAKAASTDCVCVSVPTTFTAATPAQLGMRMNWD